MATTFTRAEQALIRRLATPAAIQDFLNTLPFNFEAHGRETVRSPLRVLRDRTAHCLEGAIFAAYVLSQHGRRPLLLHLGTARGDVDHVVALFRDQGRWGAISKTNHAVLRYREPVYQTLRELVLSYFHEYFLDDGRKTLRRYSRPLDLRRFDDDWATAADDLWGIDAALDEIRHYDLVPKGLRLRRADPIERAAGKIVEWSRKKTPGSI